MCFGSSSWVKFVLNKWLCLSVLHHCFTERSSADPSEVVFQWEMNCATWTRLRVDCAIFHIHTIRIHYAHAAANLNSGYSKSVKVERVHYICTIALQTSRAVLTRAWRGLTRAWASRRVDLRKRRVDLSSKRVIKFVGNI